MRARIQLVFLAAALALSVGNAAEIQYSFTNIADSSGPVSNFQFRIDLNSSGMVLFLAHLVS